MFMHGSVICANVLCLGWHTAFDGLGRQQAPASDGVRSAVLMGRWLIGDFVYINVDLGGVPFYRPLCLVGLDQALVLLVLDRITYASLDGFSQEGTKLKPHWKG